MHLRSVHKYPKKFDFDVVLGEAYASGSKLKGKRHKNIKKISKEKKPVFDMECDYTESEVIISMECDNENDVRRLNDEEGIDQLAGSLEKLKLPKSISFGHRKKYNAVSFLKVKANHESNAPSSS